MDKKLYLLESFDARMPDGSTQRVFGYEHLVRDESISAAIDQWASTGLAEYRLADGRRVEMDRDGSVRLPDQTH
jgi:hypothetical protein